MSYLLDTNVLSEPVKPDPDAGVMAGLKSTPGMIATAGPVWHQLLFGCYRLPDSSRRRTLEQYLFQVLAPSLPVLPYDEPAANWHASERARLESRGLTPPFVDGQIAAIAKVRGLVLVTRNVAHFEPFEGLPVEDWSVSGPRPE